MLATAPTGDAATEHEPLREAARLHGRLVLDRNGEVAGSVADVVLDLERGCIAYVAIASGGFLGVGERRFAVPWTALRAEGRHLVLATTRAALEGLLA